MSNAILFVDDEAHILKSLNRLFIDAPYDLLTSQNPAAALKLVEENDIAVVVSDQRMPEMFGTQFLEKVRHIRPDAIRMILTGYADMDAAVAAINHGHVYRFINKPWDDLELKLAVENAFSRYKLTAENKRLIALTQRQNNELKDLNQSLESKVEERTFKIKSLMESLEKSFHQSIHLFLSLLELFSPELLGHSKRTAILCVQIANQMGMNPKEVQTIETAALLHDIGLIGLPASLLAKDPQRMSTHETALIRQHPDLGRATLADIEGLEEEAVLVHTHHESANGNGYPNGLKGNQIPLGARIIRVADDMDTMINRGKITHKNALKRLKSGIGRLYDSDVVIAFLDIAEELKPDVTGGRIMRIEDIKPGMVLSAPIRTHTGRLLLTCGTKLHPELIEKIVRFNKVDPIVERILIEA